MKKTLLIIFTLAAFALNAQPVIDGTFDGAGVWGAPVATGDNTAGWVSVNAQNLYVTYDNNYVYVAASYTGTASWQSFCFVFNTKSGGASQDSWSRQIFYDYSQKPDFDVRGNLDNGWGEIHTWNGTAWTGHNINIGNTEFQVGTNYVEARIPKATLGSPNVGDIQFYITGNNNDHGCFDAIPNDDNSTGWTPPTSTSNMVNILTSITLPVELSSFNAVVVNGNAVISWSTATETNSRGFNLEKSSDKINWNSISFVEGNGTSNSTKNYSFTDNNISGKVWYRLTQINFDGTSKTYTPVEVSTVTPTNFELSQNYPNPFNPSTMISYSLPSSGNVNLKVYDVLGNEVKELVNEFKEAGSYRINFNAAGLNSGVYFYSIKFAGQTLTQKMMLMK